MLLPMLLKNLHAAERALWKIHGAHHPADNDCCQCEVCDAWHTVYRVLSEVERPGWRGPRLGAMPT